MTIMKLNKDFLLHNTGSESILVPTGNAGFSGVVRGNKTLGAVLELLKEETTEAEIITALKSRFDAPEGAIEKDVAKALAELRRIGALDE
jgi:hypothetical protein